MNNTVIESLPDEHRKYVISDVARYMNIEYLIPELHSFLRPPAMICCPRRWGRSWAVAEYMLPIIKICDDIEVFAIGNRPKRLKGNHLD